MVDMKGVCCDERLQKLCLVVVQTSGGAPLVLAGPGAREASVKMCLNFILPVLLLGMEIYYSALVVVVRSFQAVLRGVCVRLKFCATDAEQAEHINTPTVFCGGTVLIDSRTRTPSWRQRMLLAHRLASHANTAQMYASLGSARCSSGTLRI